MSAHKIDKEMLFRFSLYGFLKNQQYFEPFLYLAFIEKGLSFFAIGMLVGFRELCVNLLEVPSGAVADVYGRRKAMIASFAAYIVSFVLLGTGDTLWQMFVAMFFFAVGEVFRTGTHKAIIFEWLRANGREDERTRIYGYTRSWSKAGSAVSALIAAALVFWSGRYSAVFWLCILPYAVNIVNFMGYPATCDVQRSPDVARTLRHTAVQMLDAFRQAWVHKQQRRLLLESCVFSGTFKVTKDYIQPVLKTAALAMPVLAGFGDRERTALLVGGVYCFLNLTAGISSRQAYRFGNRCGGNEAAARVLWLGALLCYGALAPGLALQWLAPAIVAFFLVHVIQNLWLPALVSRLNAVSEPSLAATTLSIDSQAKSLYAAVTAPLLGLAVDHLGLWTVGVPGAVVALIVLAAGKKRAADRDQSADHT